jgi:hypothetical protein
MTKEELEASNRAKYGDKKNDLIAQKYMKSTLIGDSWVLGNAYRYLDRYSREGSTKSGNYMDLYKASDYISRAIQIDSDGVNWNPDNANVSLGKYNGERGQFEKIMSKCMFLDGNQFIKKESRMETLMTIGMFIMSRMATHEEFEQEEVIEK